MSISKPWLKHYGHIPHTLNYPNCSMIDFVEQIARKHPKAMAYEFQGKWVTYRDFVNEVQECSKALKAIGIEQGDRVTVCLPNIPQAVVMVYGLNRIGAVANMVHPLSSQGEIAFFLKAAQSRVAITLDQFYPKFSAIGEEVKLNRLIVTSVKDALSPLKSLGYSLTKGRGIRPVRAGGNVLLWQDFLGMAKSVKGSYYHPCHGETPAVILYSGGTTGTTKGIQLTNKNFNALALQTVTGGDCMKPGDTMLSLMPVFHGFGLGVCIHTVLVSGGCCILIPQFTAESYARLLRKYRPNLIAGVPTLFEALLRIQDLEGLDLSCLKGVFSGGDTLSVELKHKVDTFLKTHKANIQVREGYGCTESVTASCLTPKDFHKEGSIGIPFPDNIFKIVTPSTHDEVPYGQVGEICMSGPTVMEGYMDNPRETAQTLQLHEDGLVWLHTGDLGSMDEDGFLYFKQRLKRMIVSSGFNIYPSQLENVIDAHPAVLMSTIIGVKDDYKMQKVKAFIVLKPGLEPTEEIKASVLRHCKKNIAKYAMPYEFEYRAELPRTLVGKVAYRMLEAEEAARHKK